MKSLGQQVSASMFGIDKVEIGYVVDEPPIRLFWNVLIETPVSRLHVINGNVHTFCYHGRDRAIGVAQNYERIRLLPY
jgi:hypothetical protein